MPKIIINNTVNLFFKLQSAFWQFQTITVSACCLIELLMYILYGNQQGANCIGEMSFPVEGPSGAWRGPTDRQTDSQNLGQF